MAKTDELYELIRRLNSNEKRYFTTYSDLGGKGQKFYLDLYHLFLKMDVYDPDLLLRHYRKQFPDEELAKKRLADHKNNLWDNILRAMRSYHGAKSTDAVFADWMFEADFLRGRKIYHKSFKILQKAKKKARKYQRYTILEELLDREIRVLNEWQRKNYQKEVDDLWEEIGVLAQKAAMQRSLGRLSNRLLILLRKQSKAPKKEDLQRVQNILQDPLLHPDSEPQCFESAIHYHYARAMACQLLSQDQDSYHHYRRILDHWEANRHFIAEEPGRYKIAINNFLNACHLVQAYEDFPPYLKKLKDLPDQNLDQQAESFSNLNYLRFLYTINRPDLDAALKAIPTIKEGLKQFHDKVNPSRVLAFYHNISVAAWMKGKYNIAIEWNKKIRHTQHKVRDDIQHFAPILRQIIAWERKEDDVSEDIRRLLKRPGKYTPFNKALLKALRDRCDRPIKQLKPTDWQALHHELQAFHDSGPFGFTEVSIWLQSKIHNQTMEEALIAFSQKGK